MFKESNLYFDDVPIISRKSFFTFSDFDSTVNPFITQSSGTGATFSLTAVAGNQNHVGIGQGTTGTQATGRVFVGSNPAIMRLGGGRTLFLTKILIPTLSDTTNTFTFRAGFLDSSTGESADGVFIRYTDGVNGGRFQAVARNNNNETGTAIDTGVAVVGNTWYQILIIANDNGSEAKFFIDTEPTPDTLTQVASITSNIPTASGREIGFGVFILKTVGTTARTLNIDYMLVRKNFTTFR